MGDVNQYGVDNLSMLGVRHSQILGGRLLLGELALTIGIKKKLGRLDVGSDIKEGKLGKLPYQVWSTVLFRGYT